MDTYHSKKFAFAAAMVVAMSMTYFAETGCGGHSQPQISPEENIAQPQSMEDMLLSEAYTGKLIIHFDESLQVRVDKNNSIYSDAGESGDISAVRSILSQHPSVGIQRSVSAPAEKVLAARRNLERLSGKTLADFNSIYNLEVLDPIIALELMRELKIQRGVEKIYPKFRDYPASLETTPSLTGAQGYLGAEATHGGLNAEAAWAAGVTGEGVIIVDNEKGVNLDHEDLGLMAGYDYQGGSMLGHPDCVLGEGVAMEYPNCDPWIAHGTAVAGVMVAEDNGHGVTGFAPDARYLLSDLTGDDELGSVTDGISASQGGDDDIEPGTIWVVEVQFPGKFTEGGCGGGDANDQYGCMPAEIYPYLFDAIEQATAFGVTVIVGGGNGQMDLGNSELYTGDWDWAVDLGVNDSGSILVGATWGANKEKIFFSNYGTTMDAFAWGAGVVTTGFPYGLYDWENDVGPIPPNTETNSYFIDNFGGTSSAAAMVGGAAALIQSYAKGEAGGKRYLMPAKLREILINSGVSQADTTGENIGKQPRVDVAMGLVDTFIAQMNSEYPELADGDLMTSERMIEMRTAGLGIICKAFDGAASDPACPDEEIYPVGSGMGKDLDFDGDGRADIVSWSNGSWKLDLSGQGTGGDNFGTWDLELAHAPIVGKWVWSYVADMNNDGRTDFVLYDKENGKWYVTFTDSDILRNGIWPEEWDLVIDYSADWVDTRTMDPYGTDPAIPDTQYSRPAIGDYNNDGWNDIAIACSDGIWRIDHGGPDLADFGTFNEEVVYLSEERLADAPGWAYLTTVNVLVPGSYSYMFYKVSDGLDEEGRLVCMDHDADFDCMVDVDPENPVPHRYGGNESILMPGKYVEEGSLVGIGLKGLGRWEQSRYDAFVEFTWIDLESIDPADIYGGTDCHPVVADFDGDEVDDRAVMCPNEWRIAYSSEDLFLEQRHDDTSRRVSLGYDITQVSIPGRSYAGGRSYASVRDTIDFFSGLPGNSGIPSPIPVDVIEDASAY
jgi:Subtilase family/FG-GAP-like repeat